jgi:hypothetical protein
LPFFPAQAQALLSQKWDKKIKILKLQPFLGIPKIKKIID